MKIHDKSINSIMILNHVQAFETKENCVWSCMYDSDILKSKYAT